MDSSVKASFWSDERVENLPPEQKLALLWLITNSSRDLLGFTQVTTRRFCFETGLADLSPLQGACKVLPSSFRLITGHVYFCRNFLRHQFGKGGKISLKNNVVRAVIRQAKSLPSPLQGAFVEAYPELREMILEAVLNDGSLQGGAEPLPRGNSIAEHSIAEQSLNMKSSAVVPQLIERIVNAYPRRTHLREAAVEVAGAIRRHAGDAEDILNGTVAIANAVAGWSENERLQFLKAPPAFFAGDHWQDDPAFWASKKAARAEATGKPTRIIPDIGGRAPAQVLNL